MKDHWWILIYSTCYLLVFGASVIYGICVLVRNVIHNFKLWNQWRKHNTNSKVYKLLILLGIVNSPSFVYWDEWQKAEKRFRDKHQGCDIISFYVRDGEEDA